MRSRTGGYAPWSDSIWRQSHLHKGIGSIDRRSKRFQLQLERPGWIYIRCTEPEREHARYIYVNSDECCQWLHEHCIGECLAEHHASRRKCDRRFPELHKDVGSIDRRPERLQLQLERAGRICIQCTEPDSECAWCV